MSIRISFEFAEKRLSADTVNVAASGSDAHGVGREPLLRELEGDAGPGGGFEEQVDDRLAAQGGHFLDGPLGHLLERLGGVEDQADLVRREVLKADQVLAQDGGHPPAPRSAAEAATRLLR